MEPSASSSDGSDGLPIFDDSVNSRKPLARPGDAFKRVNINEDPIYIPTALPRNRLGARTGLNGRRASDRQVSEYRELSTGGMLPWPLANLAKAIGYVGAFFALRFAFAVDFFDKCWDIAVLGWGLLSQLTFWNVFYYFAPFAKSSSAATWFSFFTSPIVVVVGIPALLYCGVQLARSWVVGGITQRVKDTSRSVAKDVLRAVGPTVLITALLTVIAVAVRRYRREILSLFERFRDTMRSAAIFEQAAQEQGVPAQEAYHQPNVKNVMSGVTAVLSGLSFMGSTNMLFLVTPVATALTSLMTIASNSADVPEYLEEEFRAIDRDYLIAWRWHNYFFRDRLLDKVYIRIVSAHRSLYKVNRHGEAEDIFVTFHGDCEAYNPEFSSEVLLTGGKTKSDYTDIVSLFNPRYDDRRSFTDRCITYFADHKGTIAVMVASALFIAYLYIRRQNARRRRRETDLYSDGRATPAYSDVDYSRYSLDDVDVDDLGALDKSDIRDDRWDDVTDLEDAKRVLAGKSVNYRSAESFVASLESLSMKIDAISSRLPDMDAIASRVDHLSLQVQETMALVAPRSRPPAPVRQEKDKRSVVPVRNEAHISGAPTYDGMHVPSVYNTVSSTDDPLDVVLKGSGFFANTNFGTFFFTAAHCIHPTGKNFVLFNGDQYPLIVVAHTLGDQDVTVCAMHPTLVDKLKPTRGRLETRVTIGAPVAVCSPRSLAPGAVVSVTVSNVDYSCETGPGISGSPVVSGEPGNRVLALHVASNDERTNRGLLVCSFAPLLEKVCGNFRFPRGTAVVTADVPRK